MRPSGLAMTAIRAAAYAGGGALLVAWFAAAAGAPTQEGPPPRDPAAAIAPTSGSASLAADVQAQALRLRERMAQAPAPDEHARNPFSFAPVRAARAIPPPVAAAAAEPVVPIAAAPALTLMGIAEETSPDGPHRTAVIGGPSDALYMVVEGQRFADRYEVNAIGQDAVELKDLITGAYRRLAMR
jgi:hypothetical protein